MPAGDRQALRILGDMGPEAKASAPGLRGLLEEDDVELREACLESLRRIDSAQWALAVERQREATVHWGWRLAVWGLLMLLVSVPIGFSRLRLSARKAPLER